MKAKQADKQTKKPAAAERLPALVVESSLHVVADLPARQATAPLIFRERKFINFSDLNSIK